MRQSLVCLLFAVTVISCSKDKTELPPVVIPDIINGTVREITVMPIDITTPDKANFTISMQNVIYKVEFNAVPEGESNATIFFASDSILSADSREFANLGKDAVSYNPLRENEVIVIFKDGRKVDGLFDFNTSFGGTFGKELIDEWREPNDPAKPNKKANDDIMEFVRRYDDKDGSGPGVEPIYLNATVTKQ
jgi:hypothetical protein